MSDTPLLVAIDDDEDGERFVVVVVDTAAGRMRKSSNPMTEAEAQKFFADLGEPAPTIAQRFQSARDHKGKV